MNYSNVRVYLAEMYVPTDEDGAYAMIIDMHDTLSDSFAGHVDAAGHTVLPL